MRGELFWRLLPLLLLLGSFSLMAVQVQAQPRGPIIVVEVEGVLSRYSAGLVERALRDAEASSAEALIVHLGVSGGVVSDIRRLADTLVQARLPVIVYIAPSGTRSGAPGLWLTTAAHLAAMAPQTSFGITTPLVERSSGLTDETLELLRSEVITLLSERNRTHGRNEAWIESAVRQGALLNNEQAIALNPPAIELVARNLEDLLTLLEGRVVTLADGTSRTLTTLGQEPQLLEPTLWEWLLLTLANPTIAFMLLVMAGMAIYAELLSPTVGALAGLGLIFLLAAVTGLIALPVRWLAVIGILLAFGLMAVDLFVPSHGLATLLGLVLLVVSAMTMFDQLQAPGVAVAIWAVILVVILVAAFAALGIFLALRMRTRPVTTGQEGLIGRLAEVRRRLAPEGMVFVDGALWRAISEDGEVEPGEYVRVTGVYELRLTVRRLTSETQR